MYICHVHKYVCVCCKKKTTKNTIKISRRPPHTTAIYPIKHRMAPKKENEEEEEEKQIG